MKHWLLSHVTALSSRQLVFHGVGPLADELAVCRDQSTGTTILAVGADMGECSLVTVVGM
jgi:hypothetical protein